jgi:hypothetical protein
MLKQIQLHNNTNQTVKQRCKKQDIFNNACLQNNVTLVDLLIYYNNDLDFQEGFDIACLHNNMKVIKYLLHLDYEYRDINLEKSYIMACKCNYTDLSKYLIGYNPELKTIAALDI